jgi:exosortase D (VPLPA-CTERM-specific)
MEKTEGKGNWLLLMSLFTVAAALILQYYTDFSRLFDKWGTDDFSYCYVVPLLFGYLVFTKWNTLREIEIRPSYVGFPVLFLAGALQFIGWIGSLQTLAFISIWVCLVGFALLALGTRMVKALAFPFFILLFIVPLPPFLNNLFTFNLKLISSALAVDMMQWAGLSVFREGNVIDIGVTQLQVVDACSGLRYVYPLFMMGLMFAYLFHRKLWQRMVIILGTVPISMFANALRIAVTGFLSVHVSQELADGFFHGFSGWLVFLVSFVFLALLSWLLNLWKSKPSHVQTVEEKSEGRKSLGFDLSRLRQSFFWTASVMILAFWMLHTSFASALIVPATKGFKHFPNVIGNWQGKKMYLSDDILRSLWADDYVQVSFTNTKTHANILLFVPYYKYQETRRNAHSPVSCLLGGGFAPLSRDIIRRDFPPPFGEVEIRQMVLEKGGLRLLANYWFQQRGRIIGSDYWNKWYLFQDAVTRRRTDGALVRLEMPLRQDQDVKSGQAVLDSFTQQLMEILPAYVPN